MAYQSVNPANGEILRSFDEHTDEQCEARWQRLTTRIETFGPRCLSATGPKSLAEQLL